MAEPMTDAQVAELRERAEVFTKAVDHELSKDFGAPYNHSLDYYLSTAGQITRRLPEVLAEFTALRRQVAQMKSLTQDSDGGVLPPESELPVGTFYGVLYGEEA